MFTGFKHLQRNFKI